MTSKSPHTSLARRLGPVDAAAIVVSNVIGGGIFFTPPLIAAMLSGSGDQPGSPLAMMAIWLIGGLLAFAGAMSYAELAALRPHAGGEYVYLREAFGPLPAFLTGWTSFVAGFSGAVAASAVGLAFFLGRFFPGASDSTPLASLPLGPISLTLSPQSIVALTAIAGLSVIHLLGLGPGRVVQNALAAIKVGALTAFVALGFTIGRDPAGALTGGAMPVASGWLVALIPVMFTYSGWNAAAYVAEEVRDPERNVPRALAMGTATVTVIYFGLNLLYLYAIPMGEMATLKGGVLDVTAERLFGTGAAVLLGVFTILSIAASMSAMIFAGPRVYYAMARDGLFFKAAVNVHPKFRTPAVAILAQGVWSSLLVLSGTFDQLIQFTGFAVILFAGIAVTAVFRLRWREPEVERPFSAWGYPFAPAIFALVSFAMVINAVWRTPGPSAAGLLVIAAGIPLYALAHITGRRLRERTVEPIE